MSKLRSVSTSIWSDTWFEDLMPSEKLLFIYLITNDKVNMLGVYEISKKKISFETGINSDVLKKALVRFSLDEKIRYADNHIILVNYLKHQKFNFNMMKSAIDIYNKLPKELKINGLDIIKDRDKKGFETLCKGFGTLPKVEDEVEVLEDEIEEEEEQPKIKADNTPPFEEFLNHALSKEPLISEKHVKLKYDAWVENNWKDGFDRKIKNWKSKLTNTIPHLPVIDNSQKSPKVKKEIIKSTKW